MTSEEFRREKFHQTVEASQEICQKIAEIAQKYEDNALAIAAMFMALVVWSKATKRPGNTKSTEEFLVEGIRMMSKMVDDGSDAAKKMEIKH